MKRRDFLQTTTTAVLGGAGYITRPSSSSHRIDRSRLSEIDPGRYDSSWWNRAPVRLIQTNLREIDANLDVDAYVRSMVDASANLVLLNVGGIVANYPTELEYHFRNPFMEGDLVGDLISSLHKNDIRVMGRFDFSRLNETPAEKRPEWLYIGTEGNIINYNGQVHTCPSGGYQQEYVFRILEEALTTYPLDAIFFNMIGYQTWDYSGVNHGICQCENCKRLFYEKTGYDLPSSDDMRGLEREHSAFTRSTSLELFNRIHSYIRELAPQIVISTYTDQDVDMITTESASSLSTGYDWNYDATDSVKRVLNSYTDLVPKNLLINFMALQYRHIATSPNLARIWQLQNMLHGASLNFVVVGTLMDFQDRVFFPALREIYGFHKANEKLFTNLASVSKVALIRNTNLWSSTDETRGFIKLLSEEHIMYDVLMPPAIGSDRAPRRLEEYEVIIVGDVRELSDEAVSQLDRYVSNGGKLLITGFSSIEGDIRAGTSPIRFKSAGVLPDYEFYPQTHSTYLKISEEEKGALGSPALEDFDLMMMYTDFLKLKTGGNVQEFFNLMPVAMYGPPEKNYYTEDEITDWPGMISNQYGDGKVVYIPWQLGAQYYFKGHHAHKALFWALMNNLLGVDSNLETDASQLIEMSHQINRNGAFEWIGMINHAGQIGASFGKRIPVSNTKIRLKPQKPVKEIMLMRAGEVIDFNQGNDGRVELVVPEVDDFEMVLCLYD